MDKLNKILRFIEVLAIVGGLVVAIIQLDSLKKSNYGLTSLEITRDLYSDRLYKANPKIIELLHREEPLLKDVGGPINDEELNNFLGLFEWMNAANEVGILNKNIIYQMFSVDILAAYKNDEIKQFIEQSRRDFNDYEFFSGFENLAKRMQNYK